MKNPISERLLRLPEVKHLTGLSKSSMGTFPRQIPLAPRLVL